MIESYYDILSLLGPVITGQSKIKFPENLYKHWKLIGPHPLPKKIGPFRFQF